MDDLAVGMSVSGERELDAAFAALGPAVSRAVMRDALKKAAQPIADEAARLAPRSGDPEQKRPLATTIKVRTTLKRSQRRKRAKVGAAEVFVGPTAPHGHLVEFGHLLVKVSKDGQRRIVGGVPARPFMRPAWDANYRRIPPRVGAELWAALHRVAKRFRRQVERGKVSKSTARVLAR